jgi:hypothetical protein
MINDPVPAQASSCHSNRAVANEAAVQADELGSTQNQLPENSSPEATPLKDTVEAKDANFEGVNNRLRNNL